MKGECFMNKQIILRMTLLIALVILCFSFSGCAILYTIGPREPVYYSEAQVLQYVSDVFGDKCKLIDKKAYPDDTEEKNTKYEYIFSDSLGRSFSVYSYTYHTLYNHEPTEVYERGLSDNYIYSIFTQNTDKIDSTCNDHEIKYDFYEEIYNIPGINLYLDHYSQLEETAKLITEIDEILSFEYDYHNAQLGYFSNYYLQVFINIKNDNSSEYNRLFSVEISNNEEYRLKVQETYRDIECDFVDYVKKNEGVYVIPQELWEKYPAASISISSINNIKFDEEQYSCFFVRYGTTDTYYMVNLFPCHDIEKDYDHAFAYFVECLGGEYKCKKKKAQWTIDGVTWTAQYVKDNGTIDGFSATRDGKELLLSKIGEKYSVVSSSGSRGFTIIDLNKMLNVDVIIDQNTRTAQIVKR